METFAIRNLTFTYAGQTAPALRDITLSVPQGAFLVLCGPSGSGKSTLLRQLKPPLAPHGTKSGEILFEGMPLHSLDRRTQSRCIGFVQQSPENQIVTDKVWHELAFGLESLGCDTPTIRRRVAETAAFFGIESWFYKNVAELSGGQKQLLSLASVMVMQPSAVILDEPTAQLDPIAAGDFLAALGKINRELGTTILLTEHRLEEAFPLATHAAVMENGTLLCSGAPQEIGLRLKEKHHPMFLSMPAPMRIWSAVESDSPCPVTVREGREWLSAFAQKTPLRALPPQAAASAQADTVLQASGLWFRYEQNAPDVVRGLSLSLRRGEFLALLGGNGAGKSTCLKLLSGLHQPCRGEIRAEGRVGLLPQEAHTLFLRKTVREDLQEALRACRPASAQPEAQLARVVSLCRLTDLLERHPYDLSGGEQQRAALAQILLMHPDILLLDEPTKGMDAEFKQVFAQILQSLLRQGTSILMVSHDIEFCAQYAHRCAMFFDGSVVADGQPRSFFSGNSFYTTAANRMARSLLPEAVTAEDVIFACGGVLPDSPELPEDAPLPPEPEKAPDSPKRRLSLPRRIGAAISGAAALVLLLHFMRGAELPLPGDIAAFSGARAAPYLVFCALLLFFAACVSRRQAHPIKNAQVPHAKRRLPRRTLAAAAVVLLLVPLTLFIGIFYLGGRKYYFISLLILLEIMLPFFLVFEGRKPQARELVIIAVLCALSVAGRAAFFMLPQFKPVIAMTIISGVAFGGEAGFLVGAMTMLTSNILFSQGPWTPWQMAAMGLIGFLAGVLFQKGWLQRSRFSLCVFGALSAILIYGGIMNPASAILWAGRLNKQILLSYYISGFPFDCIQAAATWLFLWFASQPMLEKLDRIKLKYGLLEQK